jgi:hypothetical protein
VPSKIVIAGHSVTVPIISSKPALSSRAQWRKTAGHVYRFTRSHSPWFSILACSPSPLSGLSSLQNGIGYMYAGPAMPKIFVLGLVSMTTRSLSAHLGKSTSVLPPSPFASFSLMHVGCDVWCLSANSPRSRRENVVYGVLQVIDHALART